MESTGRRVRISPVARPRDGRRVTDRRGWALRASLGAAACCVGAMLVVGSSPAAPVSAVATTYPSSETIPAKGALPPGGGTSISLNAARGDHEGAWIVVRGSGPVSATVDPGTLGAIHVNLAWGHFVSVGPRSVPDALLPWDGSPRKSEGQIQPLYVRVTVPTDVAAGTYTGAIAVQATGGAVDVPLSVRVFRFTLPPVSRASGNLLTSFHTSPQAYVNTAARLYDHTNAERQQASMSVYAFLSSYNISPDSWGFGEPRNKVGYEASRKWWLDSARNMAGQLGAGQGFPSMRIPISNNRTAPHNWIAGLSPSEPTSWCGYLKTVRQFWEQNGWLDGTMQYVFGQDEPGLEGQKLVGRQSKIAHECWPGARSLMTGNPSPTGENAFLSDGKDGDDLDIWAVLSRRFYGSFTVPSAKERKTGRARQLYTAIKRVRGRSSVWSYTYTGVAGTPGFAATEPLSNPRMFLLWNALEGIEGVLYGQGTTTFQSSNPFVTLEQGGELVLLYPGDKEPIPSARLEQIRDGIEDWAILESIRRSRGPAAVRKILGGAGLFSADAKGVKLGCHLGCELKSDTKYSWPLWSKDTTTAARIERAKLAALQAAS